MQKFNVDLHLHSPHSIAVSQNIKVKSLYKTCKEKGLSVIGMGDVTVPQWRKYLKEHLEYSNGIYKYKDLSFIVQTELEDEESIHHVVLLPDLHAAEQLQKSLDPYVKNITGRWAGRPHVHKSPAEIVEFVEDVGGICGPAHAFTPFKAIFRQNKFSTLEEAYGTAAKKLAFLELGLSADTELADRLDCLQDLTFLSNSDAHSEKSYSLGREFNRIEMEEPSFEEIRLAMLRKKGRKVTLNVGLDPHLGKYYIMFCRKCRRRVKTSVNKKLSSKKLRKYKPKEKKNQSLDKFVGDTDKSAKNPSFRYKVQYDDVFIHFRFPSKHDKDLFMNYTSNKDIECAACGGKYANILDRPKRKKKIPRIKLGVSERIDEIATWPEPRHPKHRPDYIDIIPLIDILRNIKGIKSKNSKTVNRLYKKAIEKFGTEYEILIDLDPKKFSEFLDGKLSNVISGFRKKEVKYIPGGGGTFGSIKI